MYFTIKVNKPTIFLLHLLSERRYSFLEESTYTTVASCLQLLHAVPRNHCCSMSSLMTMANFNKKFIELESKINNHSDKFMKRLVNLEDKVTGNSDDIKQLQDTTNRIYRLMLKIHSESRDNHNELMQKLNAIFDKIIPIV